MSNLHLGDCLSILPSFTNNTFELTLTDIPYGEVNRQSNGLRNLDKKDADIKTFELPSFLDEIIRVTKGSIYIFCGIEQVSFIRKTLVDAGLSTRLCIWKKSNPSPMNGQHIWLSGIECCVYGKKKNAVFNEHCKNSVWEYPAVRSKIHPTQKPLELFRYLIRTSSNEGDTVLDPCAGSGTTLLAAQLENREYTGIELSSEYYNNILTRLRDNKA